MTETKCFGDAFRDQLHELFGQPITTLRSTDPMILFYFSDDSHKSIIGEIDDCKKIYVSQNFCYVHDNNLISFITFI